MPRVPRVPRVLRVLRVLRACAAQVPGLALFEAGLLRAKNTLSIMVQILAGVTSLSVLWDVVGYRCHTP